jgi:hypothetical protein
MVNALGLSTRLVIVTSLILPALPAAAQSGSVDAADFTVWKSSISLAPDETLELSLDYVEAPGSATVETVCRLEFSENDGAVVGTVPITFPRLQDGATRASTTRGFGFVEMAIEVEGGVVHVNEEPAALVAPSPLTGRDVFGLSIVCTPPGSIEARQLTGIRLLVLGPDASTRAVDGVDLNRNFAAHWGYDNE